MKKHLVLLISLFANLSLAHADLCDKAVVRALMNEAPKVSTDASGFKQGYDVRKLSMDEFKARIDKASSYAFNESTAKWKPALQEASQKLSILANDPQPSYVAYELTWQGWVYIPTNKEVDIHHGILVDTRTCDALTPVATYFHFFLGEKRSFNPTHDPSDW